MNHHAIISLIIKLKEGKNLKDAYSLYAESLSNSQLASNVMSKPKDIKQITKPLFSDLIGQNHMDGRLDKFQHNSLNDELFEALLSAPAYKLDTNLKNEFVSLFNVFKTQILKKSTWIQMMSLIENMLFQEFYFGLPQVDYSVQKQKSGENTFQYILLRAPFYDIVKGKIEIRIYFNKIEDYPGFKNIEELKNDTMFTNSAQAAIVNKMKEIMDTNPIKIQDVQNALEMLDKLDHQIILKEYEEKQLEIKKLKKK